jgi:hypothetical protein
VPAAAATAQAATAGALTGFTSGNVAGEHGFDGITAAINAAANSPSLGAAGDVTPPDQGLAVGPSPSGTLTDGTSNGLADQYIAVSQTTSPFGPYTIFSFDTSAPGCPCFGDYDQVGLNNSGIYIATNEFGQTSAAMPRAGLSTSMVDKTSWTKERKKRS